VIVGYADGSCRVWPLDQPAFEAPLPGPRADGPVRRITPDPAGRVAYLHTDRGLTAAALRNPPRRPVVLPGDPAAVFFEPDRDRFAAVHDGRARVRYLPLGLIAAPPPARAVGGFVRAVSQDEVIPLGVPPAPAPLPGKPTFLAWHPAGRVLCGMPGGAIVSWNGAAPRPTAVSREHRAAVRAWASARDDFATGDDAGVVGYWPNKAAFPIPFRAADAPIRHLDFAPCSTDLLVVDAAGGVAVWDPAAGVRRWELRRPGPVAAAAFGPADDVVLVADGKGVEVVWLAALTGGRLADPARGRRPPEAPPRARREDEREQER
jgi:WD40 repeat protein